MSEEINGLMTYLPVEKIFPHPDNPRKDLGDVKELKNRAKKDAKAAAKKAKKK